jgi:hypothetical protein
MLVGRRFLFYAAGAEKKRKDGGEPRAQQPGLTAARLLRFAGALALAFALVVGHARVGLASQSRATTVMDTASEGMFVTVVDARTGDDGVEPPS